MTTTGRYLEASPRAAAQSEEPSQLATNPRRREGAAPATLRDLTDREYTLLLLCSDFLASIAAIPVALVLLSFVSNVSSNSLSQFKASLVGNALFPVAAVVALALAGRYRASRRTIQTSSFGEVKDLAFAIGAGCVLLLAVGIVGHGVLGSGELNTTQLICDVLIAGLFVPLARAGVRARSRHRSKTRIIVVGSGRTAERISVHLRILREFDLVGRVVDGPEADPGAIGTVSDLPEICRQMHIDRVVIGTEGPSSDEALATYHGLRDVTHLSVVPHHYQLVSWGAERAELLGLPLLELTALRRSAWDRALKRAFDLAVSSAALLALAPILVGIALAVRATSPGPALYRQTRIGRDRKPFTILKFRSMTEAADDPGDSQAHATLERGEGHQALWRHRRKHAELHRITPLGGFLRRTGLDELPQLLNVLQGAMSIVGPRPFVPSETEHGMGSSPRRFDVRPGITGLWQVSGRNELSSRDLGELDTLYVLSWSMSWDLKIIFDTPRAMVRGLGAY